MVDRASRNVRRIAKALPRGELAGPRPRYWTEPAVITVVTAGGAPDGNALVTVLWRGTSIKCAYLSSYTPVVGHTVLLGVQLPQIHILGRLIGKP